MAAASKPGWWILAGVIGYIGMGNVVIASLPSHHAQELASGIFVWGVGSLFLLAYYFESESIAFRALIWVCKHFSYPASRKTAFFYFGLSFFIGLGVIIGA